MTREEHLEFCLVCTNRKPDFKMGLVCSLTGEHARFEDSCKDYEEDKDEVVSHFEKKMSRAGYMSEGDPLNYQKNKDMGVLWVFMGIAITLFSMTLFDGFIVIIPMGLVVYGISLKRKGNLQEKIWKDNEEKSKVK